MVIHWTTHSALRAVKPDALLMLNMHYDPALGNLQVHIAHNPWLRQPQYLLVQLFVSHASQFAPNTLPVQSLPTQIPEEPKDFQWCREEIGSHLLVKTDEKTLSVVEDARLFFGKNEAVVDGLETAEGFDAERMAEYRITAAGGFNWQGVQLKVAHVWERYSNPKKDHAEEVEFWVFTTDDTLSAEDMREVAHLRWHIENRTFRQLNHLVRSKRRVSKNSHVKEALLGLWFIGLNLFGIFLKWIRMGSLSASFKTVKKTWKWFCKLFNRATLVAYMESS